VNSRHLINEYRSKISKDDPDIYKELNSKTSAVQSTTNPESSRRNSSFKADCVKMPMLSVRSGAQYPYRAEEKIKTKVGLLIL